MQFQKISIIPRGRKGEGGGGSVTLRPNKPTEIYRALLEFPEDWGAFRKKSPLLGRCGYFVELHIMYL